MTLQSFRERLAFGNPLLKATHERLPASLFLPRERAEALVKRHARREQHGELPEERPCLRARKRALEYLRTSPSSLPLLLQARHEQPTGAHLAHGLRLALGDELADGQRPVHLPRPIRKDRHTSLPHEFLDALLRQHA